MPRRASLNHVFRTIWNPTLGVMVAVRGDLFGWRTLRRDSPQRKDSS